MARGMLARFYNGVFAAAGLLSALAIAAMALLITVDVLFRSTGIGSLGFALEAVEYCIFLAAFLAAPWVLHHNGHVTVDFLVQALPAAWARIAMLFTDLLGLVVTLVVAGFVVRVGHASWAQGMRVIKSFIFPEWWLFAVAAPCLALVAIEFGVRIWRVLHGRQAAATRPAF